MASYADYLTTPVGVVTWLVVATGAQVEPRDLIAASMLTEA
jgi:hypothetical protein